MEGGRERKSGCVGKCGRERAEEELVKFDLCSRYNTARNWNHYYVKLVT
jgi:hypothetical protein